MTKQMPLVLQNKRHRDFYGLEDWTGGNPQDDVEDINKFQIEWDDAYASLTFWERLLYDRFGYAPTTSDIISQSILYVLYTLSLITIIAGIVVSIHSEILP